MGEKELVGLVVAVSVAFGLNFGAGRLRAAARLYSFRWFVYIHVPVLAVVPLRTWLGLAGWAIPLLVVVSVLGQLVGGRTVRNVRKRQGKHP